jgi:hypothetical protein
MNKEDFDRYLKERYQNQVNWYDSRSLINQRLYKTLQWILIIAAAIGPILTFWSGGIKIWIAVTNAIIIAVLASGLKAFKFQENWINYRTTCELLKKEYIYYNSKTKDYKNSEDAESLFIERVEELISRENTFWVSAYKKDIIG